MKKRIAIIVIAVLLIGIGSFTGIYYAKQYDPSKFQVYVSAPSNKEDSYLYMAMFSLPSKLTKKKQAQFDEVRNDLNNFYASVLNDQPKPYYIEMLYENTDSGKTVITFKGEVTDAETGELKDFEKVFTYDFILTEKIDSNFSRSSMKYFN